MTRRLDAVTFVVAVIIGAGLVHALTSGASPAPPRRHVTTDHELTVATLRREVAYSQGLADAQPTSWTRWADLAALLMSQARLTADHESLARAETALTKATAAAGRDNDRLRSARAALATSLHRFADAERELRALRAVDLDAGTPSAAPGVSAQNRATVLALLGDVELETGRYDDALAHYGEALALHRDGANLARMAIYRDRTGDPAESERLYREALESTPPSDARQRAWLFVQRGRARRDRGEYDQARKDYEAANRAFSGWPLVQAHLAEIESLTGHPDLAIDATMTLVESTGEPDALDALARLLRRRDAAEADRLVARARQHLEDHLRRFPESAAGHAVTHFLSAERNAPRALDLARRDHALRPGGEPTTRLAQALLLAGQPTEARTVIESLLATPWRTAETHATASLIHARLGNRQAAKRHADAAKAIRPDALERLDWLQ